MSDQELSWEAQWERATSVTDAVARGVSTDTIAAFMGLSPGYVSRLAKTASFWPRDVAEELRTQTGCHWTHLVHLAVDSPGYNPAMAANVLRAHIRTHGAGADTVTLRHLREARGREVKARRAEATRSHIQAEVPGLGPVMAQMTSAEVAGLRQLRDELTQLRDELRGLLD